MESIGYYISVDDGVIDVWRSIGLSEDLVTDGDIARFLVALWVPNTLNLPGFHSLYYVQICDESDYFVLCRPM